MEEKGGMRTETIGNEVKGMRKEGKKGQEEKK